MHACRTALEARLDCHVARTAIGSEQFTSCDARTPAPPAPPSPPTFPSTLQGCYLEQCGCPPYVGGAPWCADLNELGLPAAYFLPGYCQSGVVSACTVDCGGFFCEGRVAPPPPPTPLAPPSPPSAPPLPPQSPAPPSTPRPPVDPPVAFNEGCYNPQCGCPSLPLSEAPSWCLERTDAGHFRSYFAGGDGYCDQSVAVCEGSTEQGGCSGLFCATPRLVPPALPTPPRLPPPPPLPPSPPRIPPPPSTPPGVWPWQTGYATRYWDCTSADG